MWFFMNTCYVMSLVTFLALGLGFFQAFIKFSVLQANHVTYIVFVSLLYFFTETLVIFFFVGTGVSVKEYTIDKKLDPSYHKRSIALKRKIYPPLLLNMLFMIILFVLVGAVDTYRFPLWGYLFIYAGCLFHYVKVKITQNECFRDNTRLILEMSGMK